jgi:hypothetical protein
MPPGQRDEAQSWGSPPDYGDDAPPKILSFADSGSGEGLEVGSLYGPPKRWQENLILSGLSRAPRWKCTSLTLKILAACAPSKISFHALSDAGPLQPEQRPRCTKFLETPWEYRELCASTTGVDIAHRRFTVDRRVVTTNDRRRPTSVRNLSPLGLCYGSIEVCLSRTISAVVFMFGVDHHWLLAVSEYTGFISNFK